MGLMEETTPTFAARGQSRVRLHKRPDGNMVEAQFSVLLPGDGIPPDLTEAVSTLRRAGLGPALILLAKVAGAAPRGRNRLRTAQLSAIGKAFAALAVDGKEVDDDGASLALKLAEHALRLATTKGVGR